MDLDVIELLRNSRLLDGVDPAGLQEELLRSRTLLVEAGSVLLEPKHGTGEIYVLLSGELLVCLEPRPINPVARLHPGDCVGELSIIDDQPPSAYVVAADESTLLAIPQAVLWLMLEKEQRIAVNLLRILVERIRQNNIVLLGSMEMQRHYRNKAEIDALTGLNNRGWMDEIFPKQLELSGRIGQRLSMMMIDIDHFKRVNDEHGHDAGDRVLQQVAALIRSNLRSTDLSARFGGEEFAVMMPATDTVQARLSAERLRQMVEEAPIDLGDGRLLAITLSLGVSEWSPGYRFEDLLHFVDQALYRAKKAGRNRVCSTDFC